MNILSPSPWASSQREPAEIYRKLHAERFMRETPKPRRERDCSLTIAAALLLLAVVIAAVASAFA